MVLTDTIEIDEDIFDISIGTSAKENWDILSTALQNDLWFHLGGNLSSPHIILHIPENMKARKIPKQAINKCAILCKMHSKYKDINRVSVIYTETKNVSKAGKIGSVFTKKITSIVV